MVKEKRVVEENKKFDLMDLISILVDLIGDDVKSQEIRMASTNKEYDGLLLQDYIVKVVKNTLDLDIQWTKPEVVEQGEAVTSDGPAIAESAVEEAATEEVQEG